MKGIPSIDDRNFVYPIVFTKSSMPGIRNVYEFPDHNAEPMRTYTISIAGCYKSAFIGNAISITSELGIPFTAPRSDDTLGEWKKHTIP